MQEWLVAAQSINKNISWRGITRLESDTSHFLLFAPDTLSFCYYANSAKWLHCKIWGSLSGVAAEDSSLQVLWRRVAERSRHFEGSLLVHLQGQAIEGDESTANLPDVGDCTPKDRASRPGRTESFNSNKFRCGMGGFHRADDEDSGLLGCYTNTAELIDPDVSEERTTLVTSVAVFQ